MNIVFTLTNNKGDECKIKNIQINDQKYNVIVENPTRSFLKSHKKQKEILAGSLHLKLFVKIFFCGNMKRRNDHC